MLLTGAARSRPIWRERTLPGFSLPGWTPWPSGCWRSACHPSAIIALTEPIPVRQGWPMPRDHQPRGWSCPSKCPSPRGKTVPPTGWSCLW